MNRFWIVLMVIIIACAIIAAIIISIVLNSDYYYANKLLHAVEANNKAQIRIILQKKPTCVNRHPNLLPKGLIGIMDVPY